MLRNQAHLLVIDALPILSTSYINSLVAATHGATHWTINYFHFSMTWFVPLSAHKKGRQRTNALPAFIQTSLAIY